MLAENLLLGGVRLGLLLNVWFALNPIYEGFNFQIWQLITYQFMHGDFWHIFFNMLMLYMFGMEIENILGSKKFLIFYLFCGIVAGLTQLFISPLYSGPAVTIGASGAVFGVMIAFALMFPDRYLLLIIPPIPVKAKYLVVFILLAYNVFPLLSGDKSNIAYLAHLGGALAGFLFIMFDKNIDVPLKRMWNLSSGYRSRGQFKNPLNDFADKFRRKKVDIEDADYYDINQKKEGEEITQAEIDAILDKISESGYQNLTEREKRILFEASKKMN
ncbi:MAG: rhomboid family intramembrane serine protease [Ignavibacteriaceae bacterium]|nr:rhomboid family intramembrane serine protease [Ignavibacteriaceae bacterium]